MAKGAKLNPALSPDRMWELVEGWKNDDSNLIEFITLNGMNVNDRITVSVNEREHKNTTLLHLACQYSEAETIEQFFGNEFVNFFLQNEDNQTPFDVIGYNINDDVWSLRIKMLVITINTLPIDNGMISTELACMLDDMEAHNDYGRTINEFCKQAHHPDLQLLYAILTKQSLDEIMELIDNGATPEGVRQFVWKPLALAQVISPDNEELLDYLRSAIEGVRPEIHYPGQLKRACY